MNNERMHWSDLVIPCGFGLGGLGIMGLSVVIQKTGKAISELSPQDLVNGFNRIGETARATRVQPFCADQSHDLAPYLLCGNEKIISFARNVEEICFKIDDVLETFTGGVVELISSIGSPNFAEVANEHWAIAAGLGICTALVLRGLKHSLKQLHGGSDDRRGGVFA